MSTTDQGRTSSPAEIDYGLLFDQAPEIYLILSPDFTILGANKARLSATMSTLESTVGRNVFDAFPDNPEDPEATGVRNLRASLERVLRTRAPDTMPLQKYDLQRPPEQGGDWEIRYWKPTNTPVLRPDGTIAYIIHRVEDVTELVRMREEELRHAERETRAREVAAQNAEKLAGEELARAEAEAAQARIEAILENITDGFIALDSNFHYTYANKHAEVFLRRKREEIIGKSVREVSPNFVGSDVESLIQRAFQEQSPQHAEVRASQRGEWLEMHVYPSPEGLSVYFRDIDDKRRAEAALRESETRYRALFDNSLDGILLAEQDGRVVSFNAAACDMLRCSDEQGRGKTHVSELLDTSDTRISAALDPRNASGGFHGELLLRRMDGTVFEAEASLTTFTGENGQTRAGLIFRDISDRKRVEVVRRRLATIIENTPDFVGSFDPRGALIELNHAARKMLGIADDEDVTSIQITDFHPPEAAQRLLREGVPMALREGAWQAETTILTRSGRECPVSQVLLAHRNGGGEISFFSTVLRDISHLKRSQALQQFLSDASRTLVGSLDYETTLEAVVRILVPRLADFCLVYVLEGGELQTRATGHASPEGDEALRRFRDFPAPHGAVVGVGRVVESGEPEVVTEVSPMWLWAATGVEERFRILSSLKPRSAMILPLIAGDEVLGAIAIYSSDPNRRFVRADLDLAQGVADRAAFAIHNARLYEGAQQATRLRDEVLGVVSHDLRNPLSTILIAAKQLHSGLSAAQEKQRRSVRLIQRSAARSVTLIEDLLDVARMRAGKLTVCPRPVPARDLLVEALELHRPLTEGNSLRLQLKEGGDLPPVRADHDRVMQVLSNVIGNAVKFTPAGGRILLGAEQAGSEIVFSVTDSGPGIPKEEMGRLFEPFWQARHGTRSGAGLGLAISSGIIEAHSGRIWAESDGKHGTTFHFTLPIAEAEERSPATLPH